MLAGGFFELSGYTRLAVRRALALPASAASDPSSGLSDVEFESAPESTQPFPPAELDVMLPKVCEALVLVTQCIITITLGADDAEHVHHHSESDLGAFFNETRSSDQGLVESLIGAFIQYFSRPY
jgi:ataxin-10